MPSPVEISDFSPGIHPHPLLVDHIIESILTYCGNESLHSLLSLRLVCSQWNLYSTRLLQKRFYLSFGGHKYNVGRLKAFLDEFDSMQQDENNNVTTNCSLSWPIYPRAFPVTRYRLFSDLFQECNKDTVIKFMTKIGQFAEALAILKDINSDIEYTKDELLQFKFPRLTGLSFSDRRRSGFSLDASIQSFLFQIIMSARTTLTNVSIKFPREPIFEINEREDLVTRIFQECQMPKLKSLKLDLIISDKILKTLTEANLVVQSLHLAVGASQFSSDCLRGLLLSLRHTLQEFRLTDLYRRAAVSVDLPLLNNLRKFEVHGLELPAYFVSFPDFSYATKIPNLRELRLNTWAPKWSLSFLPECDKEEESVALSKSVSGINALSLAMNFDCPVMMTRISTTFLNLRSLEMHFSRSSLGAMQIVFSKLGQLEELKLNQSYLGEIATSSIDDVITGLEPDECKQMLKKKTYKDMELRNMERKPNLLDLKQLKRFDMMGLRHRNIVTDVSCYLVFLKMSDLQLLEIGRSQITDSCLRDLSQRFPYGKFQMYLDKKRMKNYDLGGHRSSVFSSICAVQ